MTCIVGLVADGKVYIGADSAGVGGHHLSVRADRKVFRNGDFIFGFTSSFRMGNILQHAFEPRKRHPDKDIVKFMCTEFVDGVRDALKAGGFASKDKDVESGGSFLVGYAGRLFHIEDDYQVAENVAQFDACGCGREVALGALHATASLAPNDRIKMALDAAATWSAGVRGPFHVETI